MDGIDWFKKTIIYHIFIDRFAGFNSENNWEHPIFLGGNIKGIIEKIPYLKDLGIETIWISPFYKCSEYHGYHITDFYKVEPNFGNLEDIKELIKTVHQEKMYIITDFVPNHVSDKHPFFKEAIKNKQSEYFNWFYFKKWPTEYLCFLSINQLPKINLNNKDAKNYIINAAKHWLSLGFDGFRLDHVIGPDSNFWKQLRNEIKKIFPNVVLIGEAWMKGIKFKELKTINIRHKYLKWINGASSDKLLKEYIGLLDGVLDFHFQELVKKYIAQSMIKKKEFKNHINNHYNFYPENYFLPTFLDNHDMNRFLFECKNNKEKLKKAAQIQFSLKQPPIIYYGTETGLSQKRSIWNFQNHGDIQARKPMNWNNQDKELLNFYKELIAKRKSGYLI